MAADHSVCNVIFYSSPRSLQEMAASHCALLYWRQKYRSLNDNRLYPEKKANTRWFQKREWLRDDIFQVPTSIKQMINHYIESLGRMLYEWSECTRITPGGNFDNVITHCFDDIALKPDGKISYRTTAKNLVLNEKNQLSLGMKYRIACKYCLEDDVKRLQFLVPSDERIWWDSFSVVDRQFLVLLDYWNSRFSSEPNRSANSDKKDSPELRLLSRGVNGWLEPQIMYFWNKLNEQEQTSCIIEILTDARVTEALLPVLSNAQLAHILEYSPHVIIANLVAIENNFHYASLVWNLVKNSISSNLFIQMLHELWKFVCYASSSKVNDIAVILHDFWTSAPDRLKTNVSYHRFIYFFHSLHRGNDVTKLYGNDISFLLALFRNSTFNLRKQVWDSYWPTLIRFVKPKDLQKFMKLCFKNKNDLVQFKQCEMLSYEMLNHALDSFLMHGLGSELHEYLQFCASDELQVRKISRQIIDSNMKNISSFDSEALVNFKSFIIGAFPSPDSAREYTENFVTSNVDLWYKKLKLGYWIGVKNGIDCLMSDHQRVIEIKQKLLECCQSILINGEFIILDVREWREFIKWCIPNDEELLNFKNSLPVDKMVERNIWLGEALSSTSYAKRLDCFLLWYFTTEEAVKRYKLRKIDNFMESTTLRGMITEEWGGSRSTLLNFFFDHHAAEINKFRRKIRESGIQIL